MEPQLAAQLPLLGIFPWAQERIGGKANWIEWARHWPKPSADHHLLATAKVAAISCRGILERHQPVIPCIHGGLTIKQHRYDTLFVNLFFYTIFHLKKASHC